MRLRLKLPDGSSWPRPALVTDEENGIEWRLRYAPLADLTREELLVVAEIVAAYGILTAESTKQRRDYVCHEIRKQLIEEARP